MIAFPRNCLITPSDLRQMARSRRFLFRKSLCTEALIAICGSGRENSRCRERETNSSHLRRRKRRKEKEGAICEQTDDEFGNKERARPRAKRSPTHEIWFSNFCHLQTPSSSSSYSTSSFSSPPSFSNTSTSSSSSSSSFSSPS